MTKVVIGVDGGTTKTVALVASMDGSILGAARGPGSNWTGADVEIPMEVIADTVRDASKHAEISSEDAVVGVFTLAGADWPEDHLWRKAALENFHLVQQVIVKNDSFGGLRAGTSAPFGVVIMAGTGANTAVITPAGTEWAFGYYQAYGGAIDMSREAIDAVLRAEDGRGEPTMLTSIVLERLGYASVEEMLRALVSRRVSKENKLALCPTVFEAAFCGDQVAADLIVKHGLSLAEYASAAIRRFGMQQLEFDIVMAGSLFKGEGPLLVDTITHAMHRIAPRARVKRSRFEPAVGALLLAYDALSQPLSDATYDRLASTCPDPHFFNTA